MSGEEFEGVDLKEDGVEEELPRRGTLHRLLDEAAADEALKHGDQSDGGGRRKTTNQRAG